jgi:hypothetical protein
VSFVQYENILDSKMNQKIIILVCLGLVGVCLLGIGISVKYLLIDREPTHYDTTTCKIVNCVSTFYDCMTRSSSGCLNNQTQSPSSSQCCYSLNFTLEIPFMNTSTQIYQSGYKNQDTYFCVPPGIYHGSTQLLNKTVCYYYDNPIVISLTPPSSQSYTTGIICISIFSIICLLCIIAIILSILLPYPFGKKSNSSLENGDRISNSPANPGP